MYLNTRKNVWKKERQKRNEEGSLTSIRNAIKQLSFACRVGFLFKFQALHFFVVLSNFSNVCVRGVWTALRISFSDRLLLFIYFFRSIALKYACICCCCCNSVHSYATLYWCWCLNKMMKCFPFYFHQKLIVSFFFLFQRTFIFIASERPHMCAHTITLTFLLGMIERKITTVLCTETNSMKPKKIRCWCSVCWSCHAPAWTIFWILVYLGCGKLKRMTWNHQNII